MSKQGLRFCWKYLKGECRILQAIPEYIQTFFCLISKRRWVKSTCFPHIEITLHVHLHCFDLGLINFGARFRKYNQTLSSKRITFLNWIESWLNICCCFDEYSWVLFTYLRFFYIVVIASICYNFEKRWLRWQIVKPTNKSFSNNSTIKKCQKSKLNHLHIFLDKKREKIAEIV